jgi:hypothetical protein
MPSGIEQSTCSTCGELIAWTVVTDEDGNIIYEGPKTCRYGHPN